MAKETIVQSLSEFLGKKGLAAPVSGWELDKLKIPCGETRRQRDKRLQESEKQIDAYHKERNDAIREYEKLVTEGVVRKPTTIESCLKTAQGHPDLPSVQAARRVCLKRGIDWRTGNRLQEVM